MNKVLKRGAFLGATAVGVIALAVPAVVSTANAVTINRSPDVSQPFTPQQNQASAWGDNCYKVDPASDPFNLTVTAAILVIKSGTVNDIWHNATPGLYSTASGKTISHVIVCPGTPIS